MQISLPSLAERMGQGQTGASGGLSEPSSGAVRVAGTGRERSVAEYFAGAGLVHLGLARAGWQVTFANDISPTKYAMYKGYFPDAERYYKVDDIFHLAPSDIPPTTLATASFPCIDLSLAGKQRGLDGAHSHAFWGFVDVLQGQGSKRPPLVLLENVPGWLSSHDGQDFRVAIQALNRLGYGCDVYAIDALHFTPQSRLRIFVIGKQLAKPYPLDLAPFEQRPPALVTPKLKDAVRKNRDLDWFFQQPPPLPLAGQHGLETIVERMGEDDPRWWKPEEVARHLAMMAPAHLQRVQRLQEGRASCYRTLYRRRRAGEQRAEVRPDNVAGCLRSARGGSSRQIVVAMGAGRIRMRHMTPREYARLQGVPDSYPLPHNVIQALTGFGEAVCVPAIAWIAQHLLDPLLPLTAPSASPSSRRRPPR